MHTLPVSGHGADNDFNDEDATGEWSIVMIKDPDDIAATAKIPFNDDSTSSSSPSSSDTISIVLNNVYQEEGIIDKDGQTRYGS